MSFVRSRWFAPFLEYLQTLVWKQTFSQTQNGKRGTDQWLWPTSGIFYLGRSEANEAHAQPFCFRKAMRFVSRGMYYWGWNRTATQTMPYSWLCPSCPPLRLQILQCLPACLAALSLLDASWTTCHDSPTVQDWMSINEVLAICLWTSNHLS